MSDTSTKPRRGSIDLNIFQNAPGLELHHAVLKNDLLEVQRLVRYECADVNAKVPEDFPEKRRRGTTPLIISCRDGFAKITDFLIRSGAEVNACTISGASATYMCCQENAVECLELLIDAGADLNTRGAIRGATPMMSAAQFNHVDCIRLLLKGGANKIVATRTGTTPLRMAAQEGHVKCVRILLPSNFKELYAALFLACTKGHPDCVRELLGENGAMKERDYNQKALIGKVLYVATRENQPACLKILLGSSEDISDRILERCARLAAEEGLDDCLRLLLDRGAPRESAIEAATAKGNERCLEMLVGQKAKSRKMSDEAGKGSLIGGGFVEKKIAKPRKFKPGKWIKRNILGKKKKMTSSTPNINAMTTTTTTSQNSDVNASDTRRSISPRIRNAARRSSIRASPDRPKPRSDTKTMSFKDLLVDIESNVMTKVREDAPSCPSTTAFDPFGSFHSPKKNAGNFVDPFASGSSPVHKIISPRVRRASMRSSARDREGQVVKGRPSVSPKVRGAAERSLKRFSFKDIVAELDFGSSSSASATAAHSKGGAKKTTVSANPLADIFGAVPQVENSTPLDDFLDDLFAVSKEKSVEVTAIAKTVPVSPRIRRASLMSSQRRRSTVELSESEETGDVDDSPTETTLSPRTRSRNEYMRARQHYKKMKRLFYANPSRGDYKKNALDAKREMVRAEKRRSFQEIILEDDDFDDSFT